MRNKCLAVVLCLLLFGAVGLRAAVTLSTSANPVWVGQTFDVMATSDCVLSLPLITVNFGDGTILTQEGLVFSGTHAYLSPGVYTITATDPPCDGFATLTMQVDPCPPLQILTSALPNAAQGAYYAVQLQASGGVPPLRWSLSGGSLPPGLALGASTGLLSGTPSVAGTFTFAVAVEDRCPSSQWVSTSLTLIVDPACPPLAIVTAALPNGTVGAPYYSPVQTSGGVPPLTFRISSGSPPPGILLDPSSGALSGTPSEEGAFGFTVSVQDSCVPPQTASRAFHIVVTTAACPPLVIVPASLPEGVLQMAYSHTFQVSSGVPPYQWDLLSGRLPSGLSLSVSGLLSGVPGEAGQFPFTVRVTDGCRNPGPQQASLPLVLTVVSASLTVTVMPPVFGVNEAAAARANLTYQFSESHGADLSLSSAGYDLLVGEVVVSSQPQPLAVQVIRGAGQASETVLIPADLLQEAKRAGAVGVGVRRSFTDGRSVWTARADGQFTTTAGAVFGLRRVMVFFEGDGGHVVVPRGERNLAATATLWITGTGLISGAWRVDDRILAVFNENASFGDSITVVSPPLPAFEPGPHTVTLVIDRPETSFAIPEISYSVLPAALGVRLVAPGPDEAIDSGAIAFRWEADGDLPLFNLIVARNRDEEPLFKSLTRGASYALPKEVTRNWPPNTVLFWKIVAEDELRRTLVESEWGSFRFLPAREAPPQVVVLIEDERLAEARQWLKANRLSIAGETALAGVGGTLILVQAGNAKEAAKTVTLLSRQSFVRLASPNRLFTTLAGSVPPYGDYLYPIKDLRLDQLHARWTGKGVTVAVVDSGIAADHPDLGERIKEKVNFIGGGYRDEIHGTAVAGLIGSGGGGGKGYVGIAPGVGILALRACGEANRENPLSMCETWTLARAVDHAIRQKADILNLSLGGEEDPLLTLLIEAALDAGIVVVAAAGNGGPDGPPAFPGALPGVISVGATDEDGGLLPSTSRGKVDVAAPGKDIFAPVPLDRYNFFTGTSMACAQVSGVVALMLEMKPDLTPTEVRQLLKETSLSVQGLKAPGGLIQPCRIARELTGEECR